MSPSRPRAPRVGASLTIAALLVAFAASISPLVPFAAALDPTPDPGATPTADPVATTGPVVSPDPGPTPPVDPLPTPDPAATPAPDPSVPADPAPTPAPDPSPDPSATASEPGPEGADPGPSASPSTPPEEIPLYPLVPPGFNADGTVAELLANGPAARGPSPFTTPHVELTLTGDTCAACHRSHTAEGQALLTETAPQSGLCFSCHNGSTPGSVIDVQSDFIRGGIQSSHPAMTDLSHVPGAFDEFAGVSNRHSTCTDCHDPHNATAALAAPGPLGWSASGAIAGARGVAVTNGGPGASPAYALVRNVTYEYQLCFECHSGYTQLPAPAGAPSDWALDKGIELNPANGSYHPIEARGTNQTDAMKLSLAGGPFGTGDAGDPADAAKIPTVRCVSCHSDPAKLAANPGADARLATHTSTEQGLLIAPYRNRLLKPRNEGYQAADFALCFVCHSAEPFTDRDSAATNFEYHERHMTRIGGNGTADPSIDVAGAGQGTALCAECHYRLHSTALAYNGDGVNRGIGNSRLVNFAPNVTANGGVLQWAAGPSGSCTLTCHGKEHGDETYGPLAVANVKTLAGARISIASSGSNRVGIPITFTVTVEQASGPDFVPVAGVNVVAAAKGVGIVDLDASTCDDTATDDLGQCTVVLTSAVTGDSGVDASVVVADVTGEATMTAKIKVNDAATWVDARISIVASGAKPVEESHAFALIVEKDSGAGFVPAAGVLFTPILSGVGTINLDASTCDDIGTDASGECDVVVVSDTAGESVVRAVAIVSVAAIGGSVDVLVDTSGYGADTVENVVTWEEALAPSEIPHQLAPEPDVVPEVLPDVAPEILQDVAPDERRTGPLVG